MTTQTPKLGPNSKTKREIMLCKILKFKWIFNFVLRIFLRHKNYLFGLYNVLLFLGRIPPFHYLSYKYHQLLQHHQRHLHLQDPQHQQEKHRPTSVYLFHTMVVLNKRILSASVPEAAWLI